jgi:hypothetical protein
MKTNAKKFLSGKMTINLRDELESIRINSIASRQLPDLLWRRLCSVVATSGSSVNAEAFMALYDTKLRFDLLPERSVARKKVIYAALEEAKVPRMREQKAQFLSENYKKVKKLGGPQHATAIMLSLSGKSEKRAWIQEFDGIGQKYSNDIWMAICDPDFQDAIALDTRVKNFAKALGFTVPLKSLEVQLLEFASSCGLTGWELDRLIYNFGSLILKTLKTTRAGSKT